jgi:hypothetical protein
MTATGIPAHVSILRDLKLVKDGQIRLKDDMILSIEELLDQKGVAGEQVSVGWSLLGFPPLELSFII